MDGNPCSRRSLFWDMDGECWRRELRQVFLQQHQSTPTRSLGGYTTNPQPPLSLLRNVIEHKVALVILCIHGDQPMPMPSGMHATHLQYLDHLLQVHALRERLHIDLILFRVLTYVIVFDICINSFTTDLPQTPPKLDERVLAQHLVKRESSFMSPFSLPFFVFMLQLIDIKPKFCHRKR